MHVKLSAMSDIRYFKRTAAICIDLVFKRSDFINKMADILKAHQYKFMWLKGVNPKVSPKSIGLISAHRVVASISR